MKFIEPLVNNYNQLTQAVNDQTTRITIGNHQTTPSKGTIAEATLYAHEHDLSLTVLIRPRTGAACYSDPELKIMEADILEAQQLGADGVIIAALTADHQLDIEAMNNLIAAAGGMSITFGTAIDELADSQQASSLKWLADNGVEKVLTHLTDKADTAQLSKLNNIAQAAGLQLTVLSPNESKSTQLNEQLDLTYFLQEL
ncbi:copper homeostasis protein CutC [Secundilactobacillus pentosiphilus]|uniref:Copper homeostasis protein cutC homolog n=1 Tax=Secundilactobacillus pentosiphilus TaxID=1714682 RepID=A0A1Z5IPD5_9LACO|nr:copper homeostasis protein CutC [Secundilactobacillus pentosiphilus]GAX03617.1 copper homeostasis protein CutC [Secundilactobacillus pentosiphilus]GAX05547.1 copper homeostasis protein CutC [Secundilactobacillus pentosiphilus]